MQNFIRFSVLNTEHILPPLNFVTLDAAGHPAAVAAPAARFDARPSAPVPYPVPAVAACTGAASAAR